MLHLVLTNRIGSDIVHHYKEVTQVYAQQDREIVIVTAMGDTLRRSFSTTQRAKKVFEQMLKAEAEQEAKTCCLAYWVPEE